ncbi:MAG: TRAP transporter small permease [Pseudomonadota bacterium]|jgi:TRAP-type C4-dicarboxylate transport system permease small subunit
MDKLTRAVARLLEVAIVACLALMAVLVFGNVVLRYGFNSGITVSEEMARLLFVWLTFLGAILASREHAHLGVDSLVRRLPARGKKACIVISASLMLWVCGLLLTGSWRQTLINLDNRMPVTGIPYAFLYGIGVAAALGLAVSILYNVFQALFRSRREEDLILVKESEELAHLEEAGRALLRRGEA